MAIWQGFDADKDLERITKVIQPYEERIAALTAELEAVRRDAERWRWLRKNATSGTVFSGLLPGGSLNCDEPEAEWDASVDAARQQEATNGR